MVLYETTFFCCLAFYVDVGPRVDGVGMTPSPLTANRWFLFGMATWLSCRCRTERTQWFDEDATNAASAANATVAASTTAVAATTYDVTDAQPMGEGWWSPVG